MKILKRIYNAFFFSLAGIKDTFKTESAFREEIFLSIFLIPLIFYCEFSKEMTALLLFSNILILIIEIINSAIEAVVDKASPEKHPLAKKAKDAGSAAVFVAIINYFIIWGIALF